MNKPFNNYAFIDASNVFLTIREAGWILDWQKLRIYLSEKYGVSRAYLFWGYVKHHDQRYQMLRSMGYELIFKPVITEGKKIKGNVDMELAVQVMRDYKKFDRAIIVSNDGDFSCFVQYLIERNKCEAVLSPCLLTCSRLLRSAAGTRLQSLDFSRHLLEQQKNEPYSMETEHHRFTARILQRSVANPEFVRKSFVDDIDHALGALRHGKMIIVVDSEKRENEGDLVMAAEFCRPEDVNFMITHAKGLLCVAMDLNRAMKLSLPLMVRKNEEKMHCKFTVSCDLRKGTSTGISARDRAMTIRALADDLSVEEDFVSPGHVFPVIGEPEGLKVRQGHTEAVLELLKRAGLKSVGVMCEMIREDGEMMRREDLVRFAKKYGLGVVSIEELMRNNC